MYLQKISKRPTRRYIHNFSHNPLPVTTFLTILFFIAAGIVLMFLVNRAEQISHDNYCSKYPKAVYCKINP